ncbi:hypothetical protein CS542_10190 [Pedobacter sp. IW39]|nr:hypothetical protein CS542_10190 [Pedobacter sp. IW39]
MVSDLSKKSLCRTCPKEFMSKYSEINLNLMRGIKQVFDPNRILNPGKIF